MQPITLRLPDELLDAIEEKKEERGFSSRSEYVRVLLRESVFGSDTPDIDPSTNGTSPSTRDVPDSNTQKILDRLDEIDGKIDRLPEAEDTPASENASDSPLSDSSGNTVNAIDRDEETAGSPPHSPPTTQDPERDELREDMETTLEELDVPGRPQEVEEVRREAARWTWEWLREEGEAKPNAIANATFNEFRDSGIGYSAGSRYPGYQMWDNYLRETLRELPAVQPGGKFWRFAKPTDDGSSVYDPTEEF